MSAPDGIGRAEFDTWLAALQPEGEAALGTLGFDFISVDLHRAVERSIGNRIRLDDATPFLPRERPLRPRELSLARDIGALAAAAAAIAAGWCDGKGNEAALLAGERAARAAAAQDVRTLVSFDGGLTLTPFAGRFEVRTEPFLAYIAVKSAGFWTESFVTCRARSCRARRRRSMPRSPRWRPAPRRRAFTRRRWRLSRRSRCIRC